MRSSKSILQAQYFSRLAIILLMQTLLCNSFFAQDLCTGSLGENIFIEGDFGSGLANVLLMNPGYAPGFVYVTDPPFDDGFYTITNNSNLWNNNFPTWLDITDNSSDPLGYMMVVNASFQPGKFYEQTVDDLCENTTYNFTADVINFIKIPVGDHILPDISFLIDDQVLFSSGPIAQDAKWHTYGFSFITGPSQTTLKLSIQNNAPGGIGNDLALDNISFRPCGPDALASTDVDGRVCEDANEEIFVIANIEDFGGNAFIQWQVSEDEGDTWVDLIGEQNDSLQITNFSAGLYLYRYIFATSESSLLNEKCRTFSTPQSLEVVPLLHTIFDTICDGNTYDFGVNILSIADTYIDTLISTIGCDSIVTLHLEVVPNLGPETGLALVDPSCAGFEDGSIQILSVENAYLPLQDFTINGNVVFGQSFVRDLSAGSYEVTLLDRFGCTEMKFVTLIDPPIFEALGEQQLTVRLGEEFQASATFSQPIANIFWEPFDPARFSCADCLTPIIQPIEATTFMGIAENENGCIDTFVVRVNVDVESAIFVPNTFTPNGDGVNDFLNVFSVQGAIGSITSFDIYDRWGGKIFSGQGIIPNVKDDGWNGRNSTGEINPGVYTYQIKVELINGDIFERAGNVTLLR